MRCLESGYLRIKTWLYLCPLFCEKVLFFLYCSDQIGSTPIVGPVSHWDNPVCSLRRFLWLTKIQAQQRYIFLLHLFFRAFNFDCLTCLSDIIRVPTKTTTDTEAQSTQHVSPDQLVIVENEEGGGRIALQAGPYTSWENTFVINRQMMMTWWQTKLWWVREYETFLHIFNNWTMYECMWSYFHLHLVQASQFIQTGENKSMECCYQ